MTMTTTRGLVEDRGDLARCLRSAALGILDKARAPLSAPALDEAMVIHELRKALKRWRALLRLVSFAIDDSRSMRTQARDLAREIAGSRDAQSALDALSDVLETAGERPLPAGAPEAIRRRIEKRRAGLERAQLSADLRQRLLVALDAAAESVGRWPLDAIRFDALAEALTRSYRRARRRRPEDWPDASAEHLHELRQRVVELRYQLECVAPLLPGLPRSAIGDLQRLRNRLGRHQDLTLLGPLMAPRQPLAPWRTRLVPLVARRKAEHVAAAQKLAERTLARPPKAFRKRLAAFREKAAAEAKPR